MTSMTHDTSYLYHGTYLHPTCIYMSLTSYLSSGWMHPSKGKNFRAPTSEGQKCLKCPNQQPVYIYIYRLITLTFHQFLWVPGGSRRNNQRWVSCPWNPMKIHCNSMLYLSCLTPLTINPMTFYSYTINPLIKSPFN